MNDLESVKSRLRAVYEDQGDTYLHVNAWEVARDALAVIERQEEEIARLKAQLKGGTFPVEPMELAPPQRGPWRKG